MSQTKVDFSQNPTGPQLMDDYLAKMQENVLTTNSGVTRPEYAKQGTLWIDMSTTPWLLKVYDGSQDIILGKIDINNDKFISSNPMTTTGDITVQGADGNPARLAPGTEGYVLMSNGAGKLPSYRDVGSEYARTDSVVNLTDNQIINGVKTFTASQYAKSNNIDVNTAPESTQYRVVTWGHDKNNVALGVEHFAHNTDGSLEHLIDIRRTIDGTATSSYILVGLTNNGIKYAKISQTPPTADNSTQIATTAWFRNNMQVVTALPSSPTAGVFYFIKE